MWQASFLTTTLPRPHDIHLVFIIMYTFDINWMKFSKNIRCEDLLKFINTSINSSYAAGFARNDALSITANFFFFRYYLISVACVCVCMCVFAITATPFNLELSNFGITFLMWISKNGFLKFSKNWFFAELSPFFYISLRFLCNFEEQLRKNQWR